MPQEDIGYVSAIISVVFATPITKEIANQPITADERGHVAFTKVVIVRQNEVDSAATDFKGETHSISTVELISQLKNGNLRVEVLSEESRLTKKVPLRPSRVRDGSNFGELGNSIEINVATNG